MDSILISDSGMVREGLAKMLTAAIGDNGYDIVHVDVPIALLIVEAAKRAEDRDKWFPHGKWATIQSMQSRIDKQLAKMFEDGGGA